MTERASYCGPTTKWSMFVRAGRPAGMWICNLVLLVNGAVLPLARFWGIHVEAMDWPGLATFVGALITLGAQRSYDKQKGLAS